MQGEQAHLLGRGVSLAAPAGSAASGSRASSGGSTQYASVPLDEPDLEVPPGEPHPFLPGATHAQPGSGTSSDRLHRTNGMWERIDSFFLITARQSSVTQEIRAGAVTFVTCAYIVVVNAAILSQSGVDPSTGESLHFDAVVLATALSAALGCALVGVWANLPFALAPGMGLNSYFTYGVCLRLGMSWRVALTCCFVQGILFMLLAMMGACEMLQRHAPLCIKKGVTVGLGLFQALVGFELMALVVPGDEVLLALGDVARPELWISLAGMMVICAMMAFRIKGAMLIGMVMITWAAWLLEPSTAPQSITSLPSVQMHPFAMLDFPGYFAHAHQSLTVTAVMLFVAVFDTAGVQYLCGSGAGLLDDQDHLPGAKAAFFAAGASTSFGALLGTSPIIIHNETFAGIADGARTGLHSVVVALLFLVTLPFVPLLRAVPPIATAAPLVIVGMHMMGAARFIRWQRVHEAMPAFLCAAILPLTYSIANGMLFGLGAYAILYVAHRCSGLPDEDDEDEDSVDTRRASVAGIAAGPPLGTPRQHRADCSYGHCTCGVSAPTRRSSSSSVRSSSHSSPLQQLHSHQQSSQQQPHSAREAGKEGGRHGEPSPPVLDTSTQTTPKGRVIPTGSDPFAALSPRAAETY